MKGNSLTIMVVLILGAGGLLFINQQEDYTAIEETPVELTRFAGINPEMIDAIEFQKGGESYQIRRKGREWFLPNLWDSAADRDEVIRFLDDLKAVSGAEKRGESTASHKTFEVDAEQGEVAQQHPGADFTDQFRQPQALKQEPGGVRQGDHQDQGKRSAGKGLANPVGPGQGRQQHRCKRQ